MPDRLADGDDLDQVLLGQGLGKLEDRHGDAVVLVLGEDPGHVARDVRNLLQALRQRLADQDLDVLRHDPEDFLGDLALALRQAAGPELAGDLRGGLGANLRGRILQKTAYVRGRQGRALGWSRLRCAL